MKITKSGFGVTNTGDTVTLFHMENNSGAYIEILDFGARIHKLVVPNRDGELTNVCLSIASIEDLETQPACCSSVVDHSHKVWKSAVKEDKLILTMKSPDEAENSPGILTLTVTYSWSEDNEIGILYEASCNQDTCFHITNHTCFNLNGENNTNVLNHELFIDADAVTPLDKNLIPTGELLPVDGTPFDFRTLHTISNFIDSDHSPSVICETGSHNFVINGTGLREAAVLQSKESGIRVTCFTDQPSIQIYVSPSESGLIEKCDEPLHHYANICLKPQYYQDSDYHKNLWSIILKAGEYFRGKTLYHFSNF